MAGDTDKDVTELDPMMVGVHSFGYAALTASEMGDRETLDGMLAYAGKYLNPVRGNGCLYYPRNEEVGTEHSPAARSLGSLDEVAKRELGVF